MEDGDTFWRQPCPVTGWPSIQDSYCRNYKKHTTPAGAALCLPCDGFHQGRERKGDHHPLGPYQDVGTHQLMIGFDLRSGLPVTVAPGLGCLKSWAQLGLWWDHLHLTSVWLGLPHSTEASGWFDFLVESQGTERQQNKQEAAWPFRASPWKARFT